MLRPIRFVLLAMAVLLAAGPAVAVSVEIDPGLYKPSVLDMHSARGQYRIGDGLWLADTQTVDITTFGKDINVQAISNGCSIGTFQVVYDLDNDYYYLTSSSPSLKCTGNSADGNLKVEFQTAPMTFSLGQYHGGWNIDHLNWQAATSQTFYLPVYFTNAAFLTPGSQTFFGRDFDGETTSVTVGGSTTGVQLVASKNGATDILTVSDDSIVPVTYSSAGMPQGYGFYYWCGGGAMAGGLCNSGTGHLFLPDGTVNYLPGTYSISTNATGGGEYQGQWQNGSETFTIYVDSNDPLQTAYFKDKNGNLSSTHTAYLLGNDGNMYTMVFHVPLPLPEPATMTLLTLGGLALLRRRK